MGLDGGPSDESIEHDDMSSYQHGIDKLALGRRKGLDWLGIPKGGEFAFKNDFSAIGKHEGLYYFFGGIPKVRAKDLKPDDWERSGTMASYSAGSEIAAYRDFCRSKKRSRRGPKSDEKSLGPPAPPLALGQTNRQLALERLEPKSYKEMLRMVRDETHQYHCWGTGADGREYWKAVPISTKVKLLEGELSADQLDEEEVIAGFEPEGPKNKSREVKSTYEMRRFTINSNPALARAMSKMVAEGRKEEVRDLMERAVPRIVAAFERITGRRVAGLSVHFDSDLPHWNLWHTGLERVLYQKGKGAERTRFRRTALNLNSSGPGLRAWKRSQLAFERLGRAWCVPTDSELKKAEAKAMAAQDRAPGDWVLNAEADAVLEELLGEAGCRHLVDEGFEEFVANEEKRYAAGAAGKVGRMEKEKLAAEVWNSQLLLQQKHEELKSQRLAAEQAVAEVRRVADEAVSAAELATREAVTDKEAAEAALKGKSEELESQRLAAEQAVAEVRRVADEAVSAAELATREAVSDKEAAKAEVLKKDGELERIRENANQKLEDKQSEVNVLQLRNNYLGDLVAKFIGVFVMLFDLLGFKKLLEKVPEEVKKAVNSLRVDVDREIAGIGGASPFRNDGVSPEVQADPPAEESKDIS